MREKVIIGSLEELPNLAKKIIDTYEEKKIVFFAEMGSGKTTLIKEIINYLGGDNNFCSPTFSLMNEYETNKKIVVYHFDFYRLKNLEEAYDIGIEDYINSNNYCFIEWGEKILDILPQKNILKIKINKLSDRKREFIFF